MRTTDIRSVVALSNYAESRFIECRDVCRMCKEIELPLAFKRLKTTLVITRRCTCS
jgi:hypothetical protein